MRTRTRSSRTRRSAMTTLLGQMTLATLMMRIARRLMGTKNLLYPSIAWASWSSYTIQACAFALNLACHSSKRVGSGYLCLRCDLVLPPPPPRRRASEASENFDIIAELAAAFDEDGGDLEGALGVGGEDLVAPPAGDEGGAPVDDATDGQRMPEPMRNLNPEASSSNAPPPPPRDAEDGGASQQEGAARNPVTSEVVLVTRWGKVTHYGHDGRFEAVCRYHQSEDGRIKCRLTRTSKANARRRAQGRPVGLLVAWLEDTAHRPQTKREHVSALHVNTAYSRECRKSYRNMVKTMTNGMLLLSKERERGADSDSEPEAVA